MLILHSQTIYRLVVVLFQSLVIEAERGKVSDEQPFFASGFPLLTVMTVHNYVRLSSVRLA